jgi:hypothetical protein
METPAAPSETANLAGSPRVIEASLRYGQLAADLLKRPGEIGQPLNFCPQLLHSLANRLILGLQYLHLVSVSTSCCISSRLTDLVA